MRWSPATVQVTTRKGRTPNLVLALVLLVACLLPPQHPAWAEEEAPAASDLDTQPSALQSVDRATWKRIKKALPRVMWEQPGKKRKRARAVKTWAEQDYNASKLTRPQFGQLGALLRAGNPYTVEKKRSLTLEVPTGSEKPDGTMEVMPVRVVVPTKYKPGCGRSFPLIIACHGGPMSDLQGAREAAGSMFKLWQGYANSLACIVAAPALTGGSYGEREWTFLTNLIDHLDRHYNVDRDLILLTGHSWGGILTWHIGPSHADTFCALAPFICAVNPGRNHLLSCKALPIYHVQGDKDMKWMLDSGRERKKLLDELGYEHIYRERPGGHVHFKGEIARISTWFLERPRKLYATEIVRTQTHAAPNDSDLWYWIRSETRAFKASIDAQTRTIEVDIQGPFEVFLADAMLDLDTPFRISRDGEVVWEGRVERHLGFTLEHVRETGDRGRIFAASVKVE